MKKEYKQNQKVEFNIPASVSGYGKIVGVATNGDPILGRTYIIEPDSPISNEAYQYSHFVCFETYLKPIN
jgi:hypothetical protein